MIVTNKKRRGFHYVIHGFFILFSLTCIFPIVTLLAISIENAGVIAVEGYPLLFPRQFDLSAWRTVLESPLTILNAYKTTLFCAAIGIIGNVILATLTAYPLSRPNFRWSYAITFYLFFTTLFNGGTIPYYMLVTKVLRLRDTYAAIILHNMINVGNIIMMRAYMRSISQEILDAAYVDGAGQLRIYLQFVIPLSKPCVAVIAFNAFLTYWNSWIPCLYFIDSPEKYTLQYLLQRMLSHMDEIALMIEKGLATYEKIPSETVRMAMAVLTIGPSILIFPFFQKYFTKGMVLGSVKG